MTPTLELSRERRRGGWPARWMTRTSASRAKCSFLLTGKQTGEPISMAPVRAVGTLLALRVVLSFLVWAAEKPVWHDDGLDALRLKKLQHGLQHLWVLARVLIW